MHQLPLPLLLLLLLTCQSLSACPKNLLKIHKDSAYCSFTFTTSQPSCDTYNFEACTISACPSDSTDCTSTTYQTVNSCYQTCCPGGYLSQDIYSSVRECSGQATSKGLLIAIIVSVSIGMALIIMLVLFIIYRRYKQNNKINVHNSQPIDQFSNPQAIATREVKGRKNPLQVQPAKLNLADFKLKWKQHHPQDSQDNHCMICLSEQPNLKLECGHYFHPRCLREWFKKKKECGVCRNAKIANMLLICGCLKKQVKVGLQQFKLLKHCKLQCEDCHC